MRLDDMKRSSACRGARYLSRLTDEAGEHEYGFAVAGPERLVREVLAETDFDVAIRQGASEEEWEREMHEATRRAREVSSMGSDLECAPDFFEGDQPPAPNAESSVFVSLHDLTPGGTLFFVSFAVGIPRGISLFFLLPSVSACGAVTMPVAGNPDLFLTLNGSGPPVVGASTLPGASLDAVGAVRPPWILFVPFFRIFAVTSTTTTVNLGGWRLF
jgi:hypothetical protein